MIADYQSQVTSLQQRLEDLEITLREKEAEAIRMKDERMQRESVSSLHPLHHCIILAWND